MDWNVLRPSVIYGEGAGFFRPIVWTMRWAPVYPMVAGGRTRFSPLHVEDLATCVVKALDGAGAHETLDLGGPDVMTFDQIVRVCMRALRKRRRIVSVPLWTARPFAAVQAVRADPLVTNEQLDMVVLDNVAPPDSVQRTFGFTPRRFVDADLRWLAAL
jgi:NADH dehydrogenase